MGMRSYSASGKVAEDPKGQFYAVDVVGTADVVYAMLTITQEDEHGPCNVPGVGGGGVLIVGEFEGQFLFVFTLIYYAGDEVFATDLVAVYVGNAEYERVGNVAEGELLSLQFVAGIDA